MSACSLTRRRDQQFYTRSLIESNVTAGKYGRQTIPIAARPSRSRCRSPANRFLTLPCATAPCRSVQKLPRDSFGDKQIPDDQVHAVRSSITAARIVPKSSSFGKGVGLC